MRTLSRVSASKESLLVDPVVVPVVEVKVTGCCRCSVLVPMVVDCLMVRMRKSEFLKDCCFQSCKVKTDLTISVMSKSRSTKPTSFST